MGAPFPRSWLPAADEGVADILANLAEIAGSLSPDELRLLIAIERRLDQIERTEGAAAAVAAALEVERIWRLALAEPGGAPALDIN
jgi:hypothetical protein